MSSGSDSPAGQSPFPVAMSMPSLEVSRANHRAREGANITVDAVAFCRVVANRSGFEAAAPHVDGDQAVARDLFAGASALALD